MATIDTDEIKQHAKTALKNVGEVQYPDLLMYVAQQLIHPHLEKVVDRLAEKGMVTVVNSKMGSVITKIDKKES